jgi:hypothetical protein
MKPYVYKCVHKVTGEFYFGYRSRNKLPAAQDLGNVYFTSSKNVRPRFDEFDYIILETFDNKIQAHSYEQSLIKEHWNNPLLLNKAQFPRIRHEGSELQKQKARERMLTNNPMKQEKNRVAARERNLGRKLPNKTKEKMSKTRTGKILPKRPGTQTGAKNHGAKHYIFTSPEGLVYHVIGGFRKFCVEHNLGHNSCLDVAKGRKDSYKGWLIAET